MTDRVMLLQCNVCKLIRTWFTNTDQSGRMAHPDWCPNCKTYYYQDGLKEITIQDLPHNRVLQVIKA